MFFFSLLFCFSFLASPWKRWNTNYMEALTLLLQFISWVNNTEQKDEEKEKTIAYINVSYLECCHLFGGFNILSIFLSKKIHLQPLHYYYDSFLFFFLCRIYYLETIDVTGVLAYTVFECTEMKLRKYIT